MGEPKIGGFECNPVTLIWAVKSMVDGCTEVPGELSYRVASLPTGSVSPRSRGGRQPLPSYRVSTLVRR